MSKNSYWIGIDTGGTFSDCVIMDDKGNLTFSKSPSTPRDFSIGVINSVEVGAQMLGMKLEDLLKQTVLFAHGSTTATNVFITRTGSKVGLLTTQGHEDAILVARGKARHDGLGEEEIKRAVRERKPVPLVHPTLIKGIKERIDYKGAVIIPLDREGTTQCCFGSRGWGRERGGSELRSFGR